MPGFTFDTEEFQTRVDIHDGLTDELVAGISETLDEAGVPSVLWDEYLLTLYGVPTAIFVSVALSQSPACIQLSNYFIGTRLCSA
jgi:hypothetical protein